MKGRIENRSEYSVTKRESGGVSDREKEVNVTHRANTESPVRE